MWLKQAFEECLYLAASQPAAVEHEGKLLLAA